MTIIQAWNERRKLHLKGLKIYAKAERMFKKADELLCNFRKENKDNNHNSFCVGYWHLRGVAIIEELEANMCQMNGDQIFSNAVIARYGMDAKFKWSGNDVSVGKKKYYWQPKNRKRKIPDPYKPNWIKL